MRSVSTDGLRLPPIIDPHCIIRFILLVSKVLPFAGLRKYLRAQIALLIDLYCFIRFILLVSTVLPFAGFTYLHNVSHQMNPILFLVYRFSFALQYAQ